MKFGCSKKETKNDLSSYVSTSFEICGDEYVNLDRMEKQRRYQEKQQREEG
jgi:hypothetical protein